MWLMVLPAIVSGTFNVLGPLRLHELGAGAGVIGLTFLVAAGIEALISPAAGRFSDRHGRMLPLRGGRDRDRGRDGVLHAAVDSRGAGAC